MRNQEEQEIKRPQTQLELIHGNIMDAVHLPPFFCEYRL